ncbi:hypothetical protein [Sphingosinicella sp. BN140058]|uniref:hypothetical protein n=1 Tax=Sphingosinicella sp. BN140058 TaxID=1892855 RepID=UPI001011DE94|nr:hypothetical protein [Sphingosinicella sp. BN140058]QAY76279.1 hypothetical protein ETR14_06860 [Sphingosinicella sp. BN140058]
MPILLQPATPRRAPAMFARSAASADGRKAAHAQFHAPRGSTTAPPEAALDRGAPTAAERDLSENPDRGFAEGDGSGRDD